jgi:hypothetical protein
VVFFYSEIHGTKGGDQKKKLMGAGSCAKKISEGAFAPTLIGMVLHRVRQGHRGNTQNTANNLRKGNTGGITQRREPSAVLPLDGLKKECANKRRLLNQISEVQIMDSDTIRSLLKQVDLKNIGATQLLLILLLALLLVLFLGLELFLRHELWVMVIALGGAAVFIFLRA